MKTDQKSQLRPAWEGDTFTLSAEGALDLRDSDNLWGALEHACITAARVTVDMTRVTFMDTAILGILAKAAKALLARDMRLRVVVDQSTQPHRVLMIVGFSGVMDIIVQGEEHS